MGFSIVNFDCYDKTAVELMTEPLAVVESYGNHVGELRLTTDRQRRMLLIKHRNKDAALSSMVYLPCVVCSASTLVLRTCPEDRVLCDRCVLLTDLD